MNSFGDTTPWGESVWNVRYMVTPSEVYLWRAKISGAKLLRPQDALKIVMAIGRKLRAFDIRGITVNDTMGAGGDLFVDVVFTAAGYFVNLAIGGWNTASDIDGFVKDDADVRAAFPNLAVASSSLLQLTGPSGALDFWLNRALVYSNTRGPLQAYQDVENVYIGIADDGPNLKPWLKEGGLGPPTPLEPGHQQQEEKSGVNGLFLLATVVGIAWLGSRLLRQGKE